MKRSSGFGSNYKYFSHFLIAFAKIYHLAFIINLLTHYARYVIILFYRTLTACKACNSRSISPVIHLLFTFHSRYSSLSLDILYLALENGIPIFHTKLPSSYYFVYSYMYVNISISWMQENSSLDFHHLRYIILLYYV
jgi:hypothetical protein